MLDLVIVGAGPAGLSCAIAAHRKNLSYIMLDKGNIADAIINFPVNMVFFSTADQLELAGIPFTSAGFRPTRQEVIRYYHNISAHFGIKVRPNTHVSGVGKNDRFFEVSVVSGGSPEIIEARNVVLATGFFDHPARLNVPGEDLPHVSHVYHEAFKYYGQNVVIVGGKNSAVETALELYRSGARVTLVHRRSEIRESVKYWILPDIINRINENSIRAYLNSTVKQITGEYVEIEQAGEGHKIPADAVFLMTGYRPDTELFDSAGVEYDPETFEPRINAQSHESNIPGLYIAGSMIAGKNHNRVFIENSRQHGDLIIADIAEKHK